MKKIFHSSFIALDILVKVDGFEWAGGWEGGGRDWLRVVFSFLSSEYWK